MARSDGRSAWSSLISAGFSKQRCLCVPATRRLSDDASHLGMNWPPSGQTRRLVQPQGTPFVGKYLCCESCVRGEGGARSGNNSSSHPCTGNRSIPTSEVSEKWPHLLVVIGRDCHTFRNLAIYHKALRDKCDCDSGCSTLLPCRRKVCKTPIPAALYVHRDFRHQGNAHPLCVD